MYTDDILWNSSCGDGNLVMGNSSFTLFNVQQCSLDMAYSWDWHSPGMRVELNHSLGGLLSDTHCTQVHAHSHVCSGQCGVFNPCILKCGLGGNLGLVVCKFRMPRRRNYSHVHHALLITSLSSSNLQ